MTLTTRRAFVGAAGLCAGSAVMAGPARASADVLTSIFGKGDGRAGEQGAAGKIAQAGPSSEGTGFEGCLPDWSGLSADEVAAIAISALLGRDFDTLLSLCAVEEFLDSQIQQLCAVRKLRDDAILDWAPEWQAKADVKPRGLLRTLMATRLRAAYAADFLRLLGAMAADVAGADVRSFSRDDRHANVARQLKALDEALVAFDRLDFELTGAWSCDSIEEAAELGWIGESWEMFAAGREVAAAIDPETGYDFRAYCLAAGVSGQEPAWFVLPLCRYGDTWRIQRPLPFESCEWNAGEAMPACDDAHALDGMPGVGDVPRAEYEPASPVPAPPFADADEATSAVIEALWPPAGISTRDWDAGECGFARLFCSEEFLSSANLSGMYADTPTLSRMLRNYVSIGSIGSFFATGLTYLPVTAPGYRTLCEWPLASEHGAVPLLRTIVTFTRYSFRDTASSTMHQLFEALSPFPWNVNPATVRESLFGFEEDAEPLYQAFMDSEFSFEAIGAYLERLNTAWEDYGRPAVAYVACDDMTTETMADIEPYVGGISENHQMLLYNEVTGVWQPLRFVVSACADGVRVSDIENFAVMSGMLPVMTQVDGIASLAGMTPSDVWAGVSAGEFDGMVRDPVML